MTEKTAGSLRSKILTRRLIVLGLLGAAIGASIGFVWTSREETRQLPGNSGTQRIVPKESVKPNEVLRLGLTLVAFARQASDLVNKV